MTNPPVLTDFSVSEETELGRTKAVYRIGTTGPGIVVCHEMPCITPSVAEFARHLAGHGFQVALPVLVGTPGNGPTQRELATSLLKVCISKEFTLFAAGKSSPIVDWLRAFGRREHKRCGGPGIGAVGMCFSGGFALAMAVDDHVLAPIMSQPSLPAKQPLRPFSGRSIDVSDADLATVRRRLDENAELCVLAYRFSHDALVPADRFTFLRERLGDRFVGVTFDSSSGNPGAHPTDAHSVLTEHLVGSARAEVVALLRRQLLRS